MKDALTELKRLQQPYLNWTGKAERTSLEIDTVSLHVHERVDPATVLANAAKRLKGTDAGTQWRQPDLATLRHSRTFRCGKPRFLQP